MAPIAPEFVGVLNPFDLFSDIPLKRNILLFEKLAIPYLEQTVNGLRGTSSPVVQQLDTLKEKGMVFGASISEADIEKLPPEGANLVSQGNRLLSSFQAGDISSFFPLVTLAQRVIAIKLRDFQGYDVVPIASSGPQSFVLSLLFNPLMEAENPSAEPFTKKETVLKVLIRALPEPSPDTPLEQILELREDEEARRAFSRLRLWMSQMARGTLSEVELAEQMESSLAEYENFMRLHRMKTQRSTMATLVIGATEVLESIATMKLSRAAKLLFDVSSEELDLLEAEIRAPGREVAYLALAKGALGY